MEDLPEQLASYFRGLDDGDAAASDRVLYGFAILIDSLFRLENLDRDAFATKRKQVEDLARDLIAGIEERRVHRGLCPRCGEGRAGACDCKEAVR